MGNLLRSPSEFATIEGQLLEYTRSGAGAPPVVLVNGAGGPMDSWFRVFGPITRQSTVFAYNRPGLAHPCLKRALSCCVPCRVFWRTRRWPHPLSW